MDTKSGKTENHYSYVGCSMLPRYEDDRGFRDLRGKARFRLLRGAKRSGTGMIDIGLIIKNVGFWDVRVPFEKAPDSLRGTRPEIGTKLHALWCEYSNHV